MQLKPSYLTSEDADELFESIKGQSAKQTLSALAFVEARATDYEKAPIFQYDTDHNHAWYLLGSAYERLGRRQDAARCFLKAAIIWPQDGDAFLAYSNTEDDLERQIPVLEGVVEALNDVRVRFNLANAYLEAGRAAEALKQLNIVVEIWPEDKDVQKSFELAQERLCLRGPR